ncbi:MAG TPA: hypothetical protein VH234_06090 [Candidatus Saccharimonadales bacterium]|jgi:hypothetical protein|nr:hypothetical protein [Candidatus Saccharimonadales bacterium]
MAHIWHWLMDFMGVNFGQDAFSTHMYNFWSGIGGDITEFAIIGTLVAIYRNHVQNTRVLDTVLKDMARGKDVILHRKDKE